MFGRILLDNENLRLSVGLLGRHKVLLKARGMTFKASGKEGHHFQRVIEAARDNGIPIEPGNPQFEELAEMFCTAVLDGRLNMGAQWQAYFSLEPHKLADF